jgi:hypothetical protein
MTNSCQLGKYWITFSMNAAVANPASTLVIFVILPSNQPCPLPVGTHTNEISSL